jgi:NitT/TauT family transport system ATP-binding protein
MSAEAKIEFRDVSKSYAQGALCVEAVRGVSFSVRTGEFACLLGPSGCGKSTLLNMIAGLFAPTTGRVLSDKVPVTTVNTSVGYMTQKDNLLPWRTVRGNVVLPLELQGVPRAKREEEADRLLARVGLTGFEDQFPTELSGGMRKRTCLARMLLAKPATLLLDEPFEGLAPAVVQELFKVFDRLRGHASIMIVEHNLDLVLALADRVFALERGAVFHAGPAGPLLTVTITWQWCALAGACGAKLSPRAKFCAECGAPAAGAARGVAPTARPMPRNDRMAWYVAGVAVLALLVVIVVVVARKSTAAPGAETGAPITGPAQATTDLSKLTSRQSADMLFNRIMTLHEAGKTDSVNFFAPMALQAYAMLGPDLDADAPVRERLLYALRRALGHDLPLVDNYQPVRKGIGFVHVVRGQDDSLPFLLHPCQLVPDPSTIQGVEADTRLVEED